MTPMPFPDATARDVARSILPNASDEEVASAASAIGLFAANCVWQSVLEVAKKAEARTLARCAAEARRRAADTHHHVADDELRDLAAWCEAGGGNDMTRCEHGEMVSVRSGLRAPFEWALTDACRCADPGAFCGPTWCAGVDLRPGLTHAARLAREMADAFGRPGKGYRCDGCEGCARCPIAEGASDALAALAALAERVEGETSDAGL